jgi:hypothetical protein
MNEIPTTEQMEEITSARTQDILIRGKDHAVYDLSGRIVTLKDANIWYDDNCHYVKPKSTQEISCIIS